MELDAFLGKQAEIYARLSNSEKVHTEGIVRDEIFNQTNRGGYAICLRHDPEFTAPVAELSAKISKVIPSLLYDEGNLHTTLVVRVGPNFKPDSRVQLRLMEGVYRCLSRLDVSPTLDYHPAAGSSFGYNQDSVVAKGYAGRCFVDLFNSLSYGLREAGWLEFSGPWGGHITIGRFMETKGPEELQEFFELMDNAPDLGYSRPQHLDVAEILVHEAGFVFNTLERFQLLR